MVKFLIQNLNVNLTIIVIGDGAMKNTGVRGQPGNTDERIDALRKRVLKLYLLPMEEYQRWIYEFI